MILKKNEAYNILDFNSIWISLKIWDNFPNINKQSNVELHFLTPGITIANQARPK